MSQVADTSTWHRLSEVDRETRTGVCSICGPVRLKLKSRGTVVCLNKHKSYSRGQGFQTWQEANAAWNALKADTCERCGFVPEHKSQLDIHHRDGDRANMARANLGTLCANCHRLVHVEVA